MSVSPIRLTAGTQGNELTFSFLADSAALTGTTLVDVPRGWSKPQRTNPTAPGYVELQSAGCPGTRMTGIAGRRIVVETHCRGVTSTASSTTAPRRRCSPPTATSS